MRSRNSIIAGMDIGSSKVACFIAEVSDESHAPQVIGYGTCASHGIKRGMVVDMDATENAIREAVSMAEEMADVQVGRVFVSLGGVHLRSHVTDGLVVLGNNEITQADLDKVIEVARAKQLEGDRQIVHALPMRYVLDDQLDIRDPKGMMGARLEADVNVITAAKAPCRNIIRCVERCNLEVSRVIVSSYASSQATLIEDERELGVAMVDIGGGTCDIAIYDQEALVYASVVPVGGNHITSDIARGLSTPLHHAERIKTLYGSAMASQVESDTNIDLPHVGEDEDDMTGHITRSQLAGIIQPRCEEMLEMIRNEIEKSGFESSIGRRVVLTGGTSQLQGFRQLAEMVLDKSVRVAKPVGLEGLTSMSGVPQFATVSGLIIEGSRKTRGRPAPRRYKKPEIRALGNTWAALQRWFKESFQTS